MKIEEVSLQDLKPYERNPRQNEKTVLALVNTIEEHGFLVPLVVDKDNVIISGHARYKAAQELELATVPCVRAEHLSEEQAKEFRLLDNKLSELATWDSAMLVSELNTLAETDWAEFAVDWKELEAANFNPNLEPSASAVNVTSGDIEGAEQNKGRVAEQSKTQILDVVCPYCHEEFSISGGGKHY